jgi:hypothetical protein
MLPMPINIGSNDTRNLSGKFGKYAVKGEFKGNRADYFRLPYRKGCFAGDFVTTFFCLNYIAGALSIWMFVL